jgi:ribosomal protein L19E
MRKLGRQRTQVFGIGADLIEQTAETAREIAELIVRIDQRQWTREPTTGARCALGRVAQPTNAPAQQTAEQQQQGRRDEQGQQAGAEQARQRPIGEYRQRRICLLENQRAAQGIVAAQRHRSNQQDAAIVGSAPTGRRRPRQRLPEIITLQARIDAAGSISA